jgi:putative flippase GtrA
VIVLVPAYEPDQRLVDLVDALLAADPALGVLVVDDGSGPAYGPVFDAVGDRGATVLRHPANRGKGAALKTGFRYLAEHCAGEDVVCADSDGQHGVADVLRVAERVRGGEALVLGVRTFGGTVPLRSRFGNEVTRLLFRLATRTDVRDTQTGLRGYSGALLPWLCSVPGERFEYELKVLLEAARSGRPVGQVEIATIYLEGNASSHFRPLVDSTRIYLPLLTFLLSSFLAFLVDTGALLALQALTGSLLVAVLGARVTSASVNFGVNRHYVFAATGTALGSAAARYGALAVVLLAANFGLLTALTGLGLALLPAKLVTEAVLVTASYRIQRGVVFAVPGNGPAPDAAPRPAVALPG